MTKRSYKKTDKKGREEEWIWEETPELKAWLKQQSIVKLSTPPTRPQ
tara:strand:- start:345 stop:485 length:141 start_codon:yes stop_codon:yes gene_type:complete